MTRPARDGVLGRPAVWGRRLVEAVPQTVLDAGVGVADAWVRTVHRHRVEIECDGAFVATPVGGDLLPDEPVLVVGNHGFGGVVDLHVLALLRLLRGTSRPVTFLTHQLAWTVGLGPVVERFGSRPAAHHEAVRALAAGHHVVVFPGGDLEAAATWRDRHRVLFFGRTGFARVAIESGVPVVGVVTAGAGESVLVLDDGQWIARMVGAHRLARVRALPINLAIPWGLNVGVAGLLPYVPLPTALDSRVLAPRRAAGGEGVADFAARIVTDLQHAMDGLVADRRPVLGRPR